MKVLMVCLGNICRSPLAEGILQYKVLQKGLNWKIDSAGTGNYHIGEPPHILSQKVAGLNGIDISQQRCRQFGASDMIDFDLIYVMDHDNYKEVKRMSGRNWDETKTRLILDETEAEDNAVPDPWYGTEKITTMFSGYYQPPVTGLLKNTALLNKNDSAYKRCYLSFSAVNKIAHSPQRTRDN